MSGRPQRPHEQEPPVLATYLILFATLVVILLPTLLNAWLGHVPVLKLVP